MSRKSLRLTSILHYLTVYLVGALSFSAVSAQSNISDVVADPAVLSSSESVAQATQILEQVRRDYAIPGISVAVSVRNRVVWSEGFGFADIENKVPVTPLTRFRIASISKPVTASALGLLYESGKLDLDAPVQDYVPYFPEKRWPVSVRQVAGHLGGIRHYRGNEYESRTHYNSVKDAVSVFAADTLLFEPGTQYSYSSYGWNLLSAVVEGASGENFISFMRQNVFEPLGLRSIIPEYADSLISYRASYYLVDDDGYTRRAPYVDNSIKWAGGGFLSNAEDLVRFGNAFLHAGYLSAETISVLVTSQQTRDGIDTGYGIGWASGQDPDGRNWFGHSGGAMGGRTMLVVYPESEVVVAILANSGSAPMTAHLAQRIGDLFTGSPRKLSSVLRDPGVLNNLNDWLGRYSHQDIDVEFSVQLHRGKLGLQLQNQGFTYLYPVATDGFTTLVSPEEIVFSRNDTEIPIIEIDDMVFTKSD